MPVDETFTVRSGAPTVIDVTGKDGKMYEIRLQLAVLSVVDTGTLGPDGLPAFQLQAQMATLTARKPT